VPAPWELHDNCDDSPEYTVTGPAGVTIVGSFEEGYTAIGAPKGEHTFNYVAYDCCGNEASYPFVVTVADNTPPVVVAKQNVVVSLTSSSTSEDGFAKVYVDAIDNGSYDGCSDVRMEIRRDSDNCDVRGNDTYDGDQNHPDDGTLNPNSSSYDPDGGAYVKFCVWDDANMNGIAGDATGEDNYNEAWAFVKVEDKLAPQLVCPADADLTCDQDYTDTGVTGVAQGFGSCGGVDVEYNDIIINLNSCNEGFVRRRWNIVGQPGNFCE